MSGAPAACAVADEAGQVGVEGPPVRHPGQRVGQRVVLQLPGPPQQRLLRDPQPGGGGPAHPHSVLGAAVTLVHLSVPPQRVRGPALGLGDPGQQERAVLGERRGVHPGRLLPVRGQQVPGVGVPVLGRQDRALGVQPAPAQHRGDRPGRDRPGLLQTAPRSRRVAQPGQRERPVGPDQRAEQGAQLGVGERLAELLDRRPPPDGGLLVQPQVLEPHRPGEARVADRLQPAAGGETGRRGDRHPALRRLHGHREQLLHRELHAAVAQHQGEVPAGLAHRLDRRQREHDAPDRVLVGYVRVGGDARDRVEHGRPESGRRRQQRPHPVQLRPRLVEELAVDQRGGQRDPQHQLVVGGQHQPRVGLQLRDGGAQLVHPPLTGERARRGDPLRPAVGTYLEHPHPFPRRL